MALAVHDTALLTVPVVGHVMLAWSVTALIATVAEAVLVAAFASVAVTEIVLDPLLE